MTTNPEDGTPEMWAEEVELMGATLPPVVAGQPDPYAADQAADTKRVQREQLARETAEYIANELIPSNEHGSQCPGCSVSYPDDRRPPTDAEAIKAELLGGHLWLSWMDSRVFAAMKAIHGEHDERLVIAQAMLGRGPGEWPPVNQPGSGVIPTD